MTVLRQRMIEDMQLRGLAEKTQNAYVRAVRQLAEHYGRSPDRINEEELRRYLLYLKNDRGVSHDISCTSRTTEAFHAASSWSRCVGSSSFMSGPCGVIGRRSISRA